MRNYNKNGVFYQVNYCEGEDYYSINWANSRGIRKGHYSKQRGVYLTEEILIKTVALYTEICLKAADELNKAYADGNRDFDIVDYEHKHFNIEFKKLLKEYTNV